MRSRILIFALFIIFPATSLVAAEGEGLSGAFSGALSGAWYDSAKEQVRFRIWAPEAEQVSVALVDRTKKTEPLSAHQLRPVGGGFWQTVLQAKDVDLASLQGLLYQYQIDGRTALDPYANSMGADAGSTGYGGIVDMTKVTVPGYANVPGYEKREDAIIYEIHVRDFTSDPFIEDQLGDQRFGTYGAFIKRLDYIASLGVTHIQLLPVMAYYFGDETRASEREWQYRPGQSNYNWGYDPHSYFAPEGMYASDPEDPQVRVDELKLLIKAIHARGMAVILDVVYNHHPHPRIYDEVYPGFYYRYRNDSYAGVDIASEKPMVRQLIVDSLVHWTREYGVDGFRFDLMGLIDQATIQAGYEAVSALNPSSLFIGEGWRMYQGPPIPMADQDWVLKQDFAAVFSDEIRDLVKSGYNDEGTPRFVSGGTENISQLLRNIMGQPQTVFKADDPGDVVQYVAAHDNLTLHDVIALATHLNPDEPAQQLEIQQRQRLANLMVLTSQGIAFLHAGQEYGRTKRWLGDVPSHDSHTTEAGISFVHNSYDSPDIVNYFDWQRVLKAGSAQDTMRYTKGLIALRRSSDAFRLGSMKLVNERVSAITTQDIKSEDSAIAYSARGTDGTSFHVFINAGNSSRSFRTTLDLHQMEIVVDARQSGVAAIKDPSGVNVTGGVVELAPLSAVIFRQQ